MLNYFDQFSLPVSFDVDLTSLEKNYFTAQRLFHPDRLVGKSSLERNQAILRSMGINEGYEALKSPLKRAQHMLALNGIQVGGEKDSVKPSPALLMESMEVREELAETQKLAGVEKLEIQNNRMKEEVIRELSTAFKQNDLDSAAQLVIKLGYLLKFEQEIRMKKKSLFSS